jgi:hypothetical protein
MAGKAKHGTRPAPFFPDLEPQADLLRAVPVSTEDKLRHIRALGKRIAEHVRFMGAIAHLSCASEEAKHKAVARFYERLRAMEQELQGIQDSVGLA